VNEGDPASSFYIIKEGTVQILKGGKELRKMAKGDSFGEQALYYNTVRGATVKALDNVNFGELKISLSFMIGEMFSFRKRYFDKGVG